MSLRAAATADVARLDQALRLLAADDESDPPDVGAVWIADGDIHLILAAKETRDPPPPFHIGGRGSWVLPAEVKLPEPPVGLAPLPTLVTIGSQPGEHLLVDLERLGMLAITGPTESATDLLRYLVAELAHNPWSDLVEVTIVGFPADQTQLLVGLNPDRIRAAGSVPEAVDAVRRRLAHTTGALESAGLPDALHGRVSDTVADTWSPQLLLINEPDPDDDELLSYLETLLAQAGRRCAVAVVTSARPDSPYGRRSVTITEDGLLSAAFLDESHLVRAVGLPAQLLDALAELVHDAATHADYPIPPAREQWAAGTDATGGTIDGTGAADPFRDSTEDAMVGNGSNGSNGRTTEAVATVPELGPEFEAGIDITGFDDPGLDDAVADWWRGSLQPPRVAVLGPVEVTAPGQWPSHRARVCQELVAFLAARGDHGADAVEITQRLWPNQDLPATVRTQVIMSVRRWLGTDPEGEPWLSEAVPDGRYRLRSGLLVDWHLFRRLRTRGERRGRHGAADLCAALRLIRGAPFPGAGESAGVRVPYSWLPGSPFDPQLIVAGVVDTAHQLAELSLAAGDLPTARWAIQQAWLADPYRSDDHPWRDLLRVAHAEGDHDLVRAVLAELLRWRDAEHPDELSPDTQRLISSLLVGSDG